MSALSLSSKSLVGRLMVAFSLLGLLLLLLVTLGNVSLYWVKEADQYLYEEALPASEAARQLMQSSNALLDNAQGLKQVEEEAQRAFLGRKLSLEGSNLLGAIARLKTLNVEDDRRLELAAGDILRDLSQLGRHVGERLTLAQKLSEQGQALTDAASRAIELLEAELAIVDSAVLAKLSLAYPQVVGELQTAHLLDTIIEHDLDIQERLNRALALVHHIALVGQLLQSPEQQLGLNKVLNSMSNLVPTTRKVYQVDPTTLADSAQVLSLTQINMMPLELLKGLIRDPERAIELDRELAILRGVSQGLALQQSYGQVLTQQNRQLLNLTEKLALLNRSVDEAMQAQQAKATEARQQFLQQLFWAKAGLWGTGLLMLILMLLVVYRVIYRGIALRLNEATHALSRLSRGDTSVALDPHGDDELTAMASAIEVFKQKTRHNQNLQAELIQHKASLEKTIQARTQQLAEANRQLDAEAKGHSAARVIAEEASKAKSLFLATMSHEIRTPLNGLLGTLTLLGQSPLPTAQKQMLALSQYSGTLLQTVLNDILDFSRLEQGQFNNEPRPVALPALLDDIVAIMLAGAGLSGLSLRLVSDNVPDWVLLDGPKLRQVLLNLLGNAIKFTPKGGITLRVYAQDQRLYFEVADTGVGISDEDKAQLFKVYGDLPNQGRSRGTGLGLAISKELVDVMNQEASEDAASEHNTIWVQSEQGQGSVFGFSVPLIPCNAVIEASGEIINTVSKQRVLVVEDNKVNAMVAQGFLAHLGHEAVLATSCAQALNCYYADERGFDAIMLDIQLGDGSGFELLRQLKPMGEGKASPIKFAAFTAQLQREDVVSYQQAGFDVVLAKPLNMQALMSWIGVVAAKDAPTTPDEPVKQAGEHTANMAIARDATLSYQLLDQRQLDEDRQYIGKATLVEMFNLFQTSSREQLARLSALPEDAAKWLHGLKGSSASMGMLALMKQCQWLETQVAAGAALSREQYQQLEALWSASLAAMTTELDKEV